MVEWNFFFNFAGKMVRLVRYTAAATMQWNDFVRASRNGTFLFLRAYMDYHRDRFADHSLLYYDEKGRLLAVMACNEADTTLFSHQGLTYGGLVLAPKVHADEVRQLFDATLEYLRGHGFTEWIYKQIPVVYHNVPSEEEDYFLWRNGAELLGCNLSSTVDYGSEPYLQAEYCRRNAVTRLARQGVRLDIAAVLDDFWPLLEANLQERYGAKPVHTLDEMQRLQRSFPDNIKCCTAVDDNGAILAGVVVYETGRVVHVQYSSATEHGRRTGAQDFLYLSLVNHYKELPEVRFFDLGTNNEDGGKVLNTSLNRYKEGFGARGVVYRKFRIRI